MSRVFKSDYVQIGTPKPIKNTITNIIKKDPIRNIEKSQDELIQETERHSSKIIEEAKEMYLRIIEEANCEGKNVKDEIINEAENQAELIKENAYQEGFKAGFREGLNQAQVIIDDAHDIKNFLESRNNLIYSEAEQEILSMVLTIARKVIGEEIKQNPDAIFSIIEQAIQKSAFKNKLILRVSEDDYSFVSDNKDLIIRMTEGLKELEIQKDLSLQKGGCIIETPSGEINSSVEVQLKEVEKAFIYVLRNE